MLNGNGLASINILYITNLLLFLYKLTERQEPATVSSFDAKLTSRRHRELKKIQSSSIIDGLWTSLCFRVIRF